MNKLLMVIVAVIAIGLFLSNLGGLITLGVSIFLLYIIAKQFMEATTTGNKVLWIVLGLIVLGMAASSAYSIIGLVALYVLYVLIKKWREDKEIII